jgi:hypothetical protein
MSSAYSMRGGPVVYYGADVSGTAVVLSPLDAWLSTALGDDVASGGPGAPCGSDAPGCWAAGVASSFTALPPGFTHSFVLVSGEGITGTVNTWRGVLQAYYGATSTKITDLSIRTLGYQVGASGHVAYQLCGSVIRPYCM